MIEYLRAVEVAKRVGVHRVNIYKRVQRGTMPEPDAVIRGADAGKRGDGTVYLWLPQTIDDWWAAQAKPVVTWRVRDQQTHPAPPT